MERTALRRSRQGLPPRETKSCKTIIGWEQVLQQADLLQSFTALSTSLITSVRIGQA
jgi:hypothetical protein